MGDKGQAQMSHRPSLVLHNETLEHFHTHPTPVQILSLITLCTKCLFQNNFKSSQSLRPEDLFYNQSLSALNIFFVVCTHLRKYVYGHHSSMPSHYRLCDDRTRSAPVLNLHLETGSPAPHWACQGGHLSPPLSRFPWVLEISSQVLMFMCPCLLLLTKQVNSIGLDGFLMSTELNDREQFSSCSLCRNKL